MLTREIARRKTFAIISHPDAGKTTLTEKLLLYGGAIQLAGAVKAKKARAHAVSDWMEMERERGISISTSVLQFPYKGRLLSLVDTPGHADFSEDTYRALMATDAAIMILDCAKGVETQTKKLFRVCKLRQMPIFTFVNKLDRPGRDPFELIGEVEEVLGIGVYPVTWPIFGGAASSAASTTVSASRCFLFEQVAHGAEIAPDGGRSASTRPSSSRRSTTEGAGQLREDIELIDAAGDALDRGRARPRRGHADVLRQRHHQLRPAAVPATPSSSSCRSPAPARQRQGPHRSGRRPLHRLRLQDPGEHGPRPPRQRSRSSASAPAATSAG